jgi:lipase chaperone LimK
VSATISAAIEPLIRKKIFNTEEEAIRVLTREYILRQIDALRRKIGRFERKYGMHFQQFSDYLHERSVLLERSELSAKQRQTLGRAIMQEEDDWLDWKASQEMIESWIGLRQEIAA